MLKNRDSGGRIRRGYRTEKSSFGAYESVLIREELFVPFIGGKSDSHLGHYSAHDRSETLVETKECFSFDYVLPGFKEPSRFRLQEVRAMPIVSNTVLLTPGARFRLDSCIRTLIVSWSLQYVSWLLS